MKSSLFIVGLFVYSCTSPGQPAPLAKVSKDSVGVVSKSPCEGIDWSNDTLFKSPAPSFIYEPLRGAGGGFSCKIKLENGFLGLIAAVGDEENVLTVFQADSLQYWIQVYCGPLEPAMSYDVEMPDLNFDGHKDLLIDANSGGNFGKSSIGFLFDPKSRIFRRDTALDLENMSIDTKGKRLRSRHYSSIYGGNVKWLYGWEGDSLVLLGEAVYHAEVDSAIITLKTRQKNGSLKPTNIFGEKEAVWDVFDLNCLWKGNFSID